MSRHRLIVIAMMSTALFGVTSQVDAEPSKFKWGGVTVFAAKALLTNWEVETDLKRGFELSFQNNAKALAFARKGFRIRLFRADANWRPLPYDTGESIPFQSFPPCDIYLSSRWPPGRSSGVRLVLGGPSDLGYLTATPSGKLGDGNWLLIFEDGGDDHDVLRLNHMEAAAYFAYAARLVIHTGGASYRVSDLPNPSIGDIQALKLMKAEAELNSPTRDCLHVQQATAAATVKITQLETCSGRAPASAASPQGG